MRFTRMMIHSNIVLLLLVFASSDTVARDCEQDDGSSVIETSRCLCEFMIVSPCVSVM